MEKIHYPGAKTPKPQKKTQVLIDNVNEILEKYGEMTLRSVFYKLVSHYGRPNNKNSYNNLGKSITSYRNSGLIYWGLIDSSRTLNEPWWYDDIADFVDPYKYKINLHEGQPYHIELWTEKNTIEVFVGKLVASYNIAYQSNRGYLSTTIKHDRAIGLEYLEKPVKIIYFGDYDPAGLNMIEVMKRDTTLYAPSLDIEFIHIGITYDQVIKYNIPHVYDKPGCYELDALDPDVMRDLVKEKIEELIDWDLYLVQIDKQDKEREKLEELIKLLN